MLQRNVNFERIFVRPFVIALLAIKTIRAVHNSSMIDHVTVTAELAFAKLANVCHIHMLSPKMMPYIDT